MDPAELILYSNVRRAITVSDRILLLASSLHASRLGLRCHYDQRLPDIGALEEKRLGGCGSMTSGRDGVSRHPPPSRSSYKSPYLVPVLENRLPPTDDDIFSLDARTLHDEPFSLDVSEESDAEDDDAKQDDGMHLEGVPRSTQHFDAKRYTTPEFARQLLLLLSEDLHLPGWSDLDPSIDPDSLSIFKVSGALTNAVFFVSCVMEQDRRTPPTVLIRVYGPSSGSLLSRRHELHVLHTLSAEYGFGPHVLGTFANGRVEEFFESKALNKHLIRDPRLSCWIARRMKELHSVNPELMRLPDAKSPTLRPLMHHHNSSNISLLSTSSTGSVFSFGSSMSSASVRSRSKAPSRGTSMSSSLPRSGVTEVPAAIKRRASHASLYHRVPTRRHSHESNLGIWVNIASWTREGSKVLKLADGIPHLTRLSNNDAGRSAHPLSSRNAFAAFVSELDMSRFEREIKAYKVWVSNWEKQHGRGKRVFAHNDAQYGNVLLRSGFEEDPLADVDAAIQEVGLARPHELLIVVDFEYAALNPRAFDIANHFLEWKADYHSIDSHSMNGSYPTWHQRRRFYHAYIGSDGGQDPPPDEPQLDSSAKRKEPEDEDARVLRLEEEVQAWTPSSHAMWIVWALVQARDQVEAAIERWSDSLPGSSPDLELHREDTARGEVHQTTPPSSTSGLRGSLAHARLKMDKWRGPRERREGYELQRHDTELPHDPVAAPIASRPHLERGKSGEGTEGDDDFDYLLYARGRMVQFRHLLHDMHVMDV